MNEKPILTRTMTDNELLLKIRAKHKPAFDQLFRQYYKPLCIFCYNIVRDKIQAEEIVQEFFITIWEQPPLVTESVKAYFYKSIYNRSLHCIEKVHTRIRNEDSYSKNQPETTEQESESQHEELELKQHLQNAINELPEKCKEIFVMCKYNEMSYSQVSELLNISPKTVENQMGIALKKIREYILPFRSKNDF